MHEIKGGQQSDSLHLHKQCRHVTGNYPNTYKMWKVKSQVEVKRSLYEMVL